MIVISLGSNLPGEWGTPEQTLRRAVDELSRSGIQIIGASSLYCTVALADAPQPNYLNAIAAVSTPMRPCSLLQVLEQLEVQAGRLKSQKGRRVPRPLDLDIVDYKGAICNWKRGRPLPAKRVVLPHPEAHKRAFVLLPLSSILPHWHHPVFGLTAAELMKRPFIRSAGSILGEAGALV
jgi:2-amino-4-hydroxy-6-hydroxymethyldihydropteridine diphosphokinase